MRIQSVLRRPPRLTFLRSGTRRRSASGVRSRRILRTTRAGGADFGRSRLFARHCCRAGRREVLFTFFTLIGAAPSVLTLVRGGASVAFLDDSSRIGGERPGFSLCAVGCFVSPLQRPPRQSWLVRAHRPTLSARPARRHTNRATF